MLVVAIRLFYKAMSTISIKQCPSQLNLPKWKIRAVTEDIQRNFQIFFQKWLRTHFRLAEKTPRKKDITHTVSDQFLHLSKR